MYPSSQTTLPPGYVLQVFDTLDSTNAEALRRHELGQGSHGDVLVATVQTAGRGRRGRNWLSLPGNLHSTIVVSPPSGRSPPQLAFVAGVAVRQALCALAPGLNPSLKWPNDVTCNGMKIAGVLIEAMGSSYAVGMGINLALAPAAGDLRSPATCLKEVTGLETESGEMLRLLCGSFDEWYGKWTREGFSDVRDAWLAAAHPVGTGITAAAAAGEIRGSFAGLTDDGALLLDVGGKRHLVAAGDIEIRAQA